jgi:hypothetical protein
VRVIACTNAAAVQRREMVCHQDEGEMDTERYTWTLRVSTAPQNNARVFVRQQQFTVGAPVQFDAAYHAISALEYVLGAIGAEVVNGLQLLARKRLVEIDSVEAVVQGELNNPLVALGVVGESGHPGLEKVQVKVYVASLAAAEDIQHLWQEVLARSPLLRTFQPLIQLDLSLQVVI